MISNYDTQYLTGIFETSGKNRSTEGTMSLYTPCSLVHYDNTIHGYTLLEKSMYSEKSNLSFIDMGQGIRAQKQESSSHACM